MRVSPFSQEPLEEQGAGTKTAASGGSRRCGLDFPKLQAKCCLNQATVRSQAILACAST